MTLQYPFTFELAVWPTSAQAPLTYLISFGSVALYFFLIRIIFPLFTKYTKDSSTLKNLRVLHNISLWIYSSFTCITIFQYLLRKGELYDFYSFTCVPIDNPKIKFLSKLFIYSKLYEWIDTFFLILSGKKPIFLHTYHHATTFFLFLIVSNFPGAEKSGMLLNGFVHSLMYHHFAFNWINPLRMLITISQILQLGFVTWLWSITPRTCPEHADFVDKYPLEFIFPFLMVPVYLFLFIHFFYKSFLKPVLSTKKSTLKRTKVKKRK